MRLFAVCLLMLTSLAHADSLVVSAAASLKEALGEINAAYTLLQPAVKVETNFGASGALQQQIENGAPVDVFFSAAAKQMDALEKKGLLLANSKTDLLGNDVVLITPPGFQGALDFPGLVGASIKHIAIGDPGSVPAGQYAEEVFRFYKINEALTPRFVLAKDVRQVLTYVETGNAEAGVVYRTDALQSGKVTIQAAAPADSHKPVIYPVAVLAVSKQPESARAYVAFLASDEAKAVFEKYGFHVLVKQG